MPLYKPRNVMKLTFQCNGNSRTCDREVCRCQFPNMLEFEGQVRELRMVLMKHLGMIQEGDLKLEIDEEKSSI